MGLLFIFILAGLMAVLGSLSYNKGFPWSPVAFAILLGAFVAIERQADVIVRYMNGMYIGVLLVFRSGLNDIAAGDLDSAGEKLAGIKKPFEGSTEGLALLIIMLLAVVIAVVLAQFIKGKRSLLGGLLGLASGYVLAASFLPGVFGMADCALPVPPLRAACATAAEGALTAASSAIDTTSVMTQFLDGLIQPGNVQFMAIAIAVGIALFLILSTRFANR